VTEGESNFVYVVIAGPKAQKRPVRAGSRTEGLVEILEGVRPGDVVIVAGQHGLPDGAPVRMAGREAAAPGDSAGTLRTE
jgi:membrane fusion protein, multidrug efflux system